MRSLVIKCTAGADDLERSNQAFTVAAAAIAAGADVTLWLTGEAAWFGVPGRAEAVDIPLATPIAELRDLIVDSGSLIMCSQCAARRGIAADSVIPGVSIAGAASFAEAILADSVQALVY